MKKSLNILILLLLGFAFQVSAQLAEPYTDSVKEAGNFSFVDDNYIAATLDSLSTLKYFESNENITNHLRENKYNFLPDFIPTYPDSVYYYRIQQLDVGSPIELTYNSYVRSFIDLYAKKKRSTTERVLGLSRMYFPIFEPLLDQYNVPLELKYLAIVESALNAKARSRVGAGGLWQFMYYTGKVYGLEITSFVDDRNDPLKATVAACRHFQDLYNIYHDWLLVLAAYNSGPGNVNKAIRRSGGKMTFWEIMPYLPRETRDYVPAFIAVNYVMAFSREHNIYPEMPKILYDETDTVAIHQPVTISLLSEKLKLTVEDLEFLNPTFRKGFIPATPSNPFFIRLPKKSIADFINNEPSLYAYFQLKGYDAAQFESSPDDYDIITKRITYKVRKGETLATIARKYDCTTAEIKKWNKLKKSSVYKGQPLKLYVQTKQPSVKAKAPKANPETIETALANDSLSAEKQLVKTEIPKVETVEKARYHTIKTGETLPVIAKKYGISANNLMVWNNLKSQKLIAGKKLQVNNPVKNMAESDLIASAKKPEPKSKTDKPIVDSDLDCHIVEKGEYVGKIATKYGITVDELVTWNNLKNNSLQIGQKLWVKSPDLVETKASGSPKEVIADKTEENAKLVYYTVKPGDTLWSISQKYEGVTIEQLKEWNKITDSSLKVGQQIKVLLAGG